MPRVLTPLVWAAPAIYKPLSMWRMPWHATFKEWVVPSRRPEWFRALDFWSHSRDLWAYAGQSSQSVTWDGVGGKLRQHQRRAVRRWRQSHEKNVGSATSWAGLVVVTAKTQNWERRRVQGTKESRGPCSWQRHILGWLAGWRRGKDSERKHLKGTRELRVPSSWQRRSLGLWFLACLMVYHWEARREDRLYRLSILAF